MQSKLWTRDFCLVSLVSLLVYLVFYGIMVVIALYALKNLQATKMQAGLAAGDFLLAALLARIFTGHKLERGGKRRLLLLGLTAFLLCQALYLLAANIYLLIGIRFLHGLAFGMCATVLSTLATTYIPQARRGEGMGYFLLSITLASALGPFLGLYVYQNFSFEALLGVCLIFCGSGLLLSWPLQAPDEKEPGPAKTAVPEIGLESYLELKALPMAGISFLIYLCYSSLMTFFSAYVSELNMLQAGQYFFLVYSLAIIVSRPPVGKLADNRGYNSVMYPSFVVFALGLLLLSIMRTAGLMFTAAVLLGVGFGTFAAMGQVIVIQQIPKERVGIALSTLLSISELGTGVGPFLIGGLLEFLGFSRLYQLVAVLVLISLGLYHAGCRRHYI